MDNSKIEEKSKDYWFGYHMGINGFVTFGYSGNMSPNEVNKGWQDGYTEYEKVEQK